jgi:AcrR family transcriptional regulator
MSEATRGTDPATAEVDGRKLRRQRGRAAVTDAMIDLVLEGHLPPSVEQLAVRSDVSVASIFRYFDGLDDLRRAATEVYFRRYDHLFEIPAIGEGTPAERIERIVDVRLRLYTITGPMGQLVRIRAHDDATARDNLGRVRDTYTDQLRHHFDTELSALTTEKRDDLVGVVATLTSFESWEQLSCHEGRTDGDIRRAWSQALTRLIAAR